MGVTNLWTVLQPCARPTKLSTLTDKRLAIDASIWIYQFLKAMRNKEGDALRAAHVIGFFRRICKLLFLGVRPVFVFDGGVPDLKRRTIAKRKSRREGHRDDAKRTAEKLLITQLHRAARVQAEDEKAKRRSTGSATTTPSKSLTPQKLIQDKEKKDSLPEDTVYVSELFMSPAERQQARIENFRPEDKYHLPEMPASISEMAGASDPRVMSLAELEAYAREFETEGDDQTDIGIYDLSQIDFDGQLFRNLPVTDQYKIISAARLRSRLRMGLSKDQLDSIFPDRMAFSKFQIERVRERNELTQRLMLLVGMTDHATFQTATGVGGRIASDKGREYVLVKNEGVDGGWALGVVGGSRRHGHEFNEGGKSRPITLDSEVEGDTLGSQTDRVSDDDDDDDDTEFEDVPIEGINRLPRSLLISPANRANSQHHAEAVRRFAAQRQAVYEMRQQQHQHVFMPVPTRLQLPTSSSPPLPLNEDEAGRINSLFVGDSDDEVEDVDLALQKVLETYKDGYRTERTTDRTQRYSSPFEPEIDEDNELAVQQAISLSLQQVQVDRDRRNGSIHEASSDADVESDSDYFEEVFHGQAQAKDPWTVGDRTTQSGLSIAQMANRRSRQVAMSGDQRDRVDAPTKPLDQQDDGDDDDLSHALMASRRNIRQGSKGWENKEETESKIDFNVAFETPEKLIEKVNKSEERSAPRNGPLPFSKLNLGTSLFGKRNPKGKELADPLDQDPNAGGFILPRPKEDEEGDTEQITDNRKIEETKKKKPSECPPWFRDDDNGAGNRTGGDDKSKVSSFTGVTAPKLQEGEKEGQSLPSSVEHPIFILQDSTDEQAGLIYLNKESDPESSEDEDEFEDVPGMRIQAKSDFQPTHATEGDPQFPMRLSESVTLHEPEASTPQKSISTPQITHKYVAHRAIGSPDTTLVSTPKSSLRSELSTPKSRLNSQVTFDMDTVVTPQSSQMATAVVDDQYYTVGSDDEDDPEDIPSDDELLENMAQESEEHARFAAEIASASSFIHTPAQTIADLEKEIDQLRAKQRKDLRDSDDVSQTMILECQELLTLFGLPYITAPTEAEAQCAQLLQQGLVDGIVTDDSDTFLFGGSFVYKNMFNQSRFVECFLSRDLASEFGLDRKRLIDMAILLGSDYTEGLKGVGPVTALEIVSEFDSLEGFGSWWSEAQKKPLTSSMNSPSSSASTDPIFSTKFRRLFHRSHASKLFLPSNFPDRTIVDAYMNPSVDPDPTPFVWGVPNLDQLRSFLGATAGWTPEKTDEVLVPVVQDLNRRQREGRQTNITKFMEPMEVRKPGVVTGKRKRLSRMESALGKMKDKKQRRLIKDIEENESILDDVDFAAELAD